MAAGPAAPRPAIAPPALWRFLPALLAVLSPTCRPCLGSLIRRGHAGRWAVGFHEDGLAAELGRRAAPAPDARVTVFERHPPSGSATAAPADPWAAAAAPTLELRPPPLPARLPLLGPRLLSAALLGAHSREATQPCTPGSSGRVFPPLRATRRVWSLVLSRSLRCYARSSRTRDPAPAVENNSFLLFLGDVKAYDVGGLRLRQRSLC